jgi:hypothetical protein
MPYFFRRLIVHRYMAIPILWAVYPDWCGCDSGRRPPRCWARAVLSAPARTVRYK